MVTVTKSYEKLRVFFCVDQALVRTGIVTAISGLLKFGNRSKCDLLSAVGEIDLILCFSVYNDRLFCFVDSEKSDAK